MSKIFVSYDKSDKKTAKKLVSKLETDGRKCVIIPRDTSGIETPEVVSELIEECSIFLFVLSEISDKSKVISKQIEHAAEHGLSVIPFKVSKTTDSVTMSYFLSALDWVDAFEDGFDDSYDILLEILEEVTGNAGNITRKSTEGSKEQAVSGISNKNLFIAIAVIVILAVGGYLFMNSDKNETLSETEIVASGEELLLNSEDAVVGNWRVLTYEDNRKMTEEERKINQQNVEYMKKSVLIVFNQDKSFERHGYSEQPQKGTWDYSDVEKKIFLIPVGSNKKEEMNIIKMTKSFMTMIVVENVKNQFTNKIETVTTKITFKKQ